MQFANRYISFAENIIQTYDGAVPFHLYIKSYFAANKKFGSKDRKAITTACYAYFRLGKALNDLSLHERMIAGLFLSATNLSNWQSVFPEKWLIYINESLAVKINFLTAVYPAIQIESIFPFNAALSAGIEKTTFSLSHLVQPDVFIRARPGKHKNVINALNKAAIAFDIEKDTADCIRLSANSAIDKIILLNKDAVVQDKSSQRVGTLVSGLLGKIKAVWDCCAASGGKSILLKDILGNIPFHATDIRPSIIHNLIQRFG
jgi:16S rRNA (cytosine967-C5)-methyltransferase